VSTFAFIGVGVGVLGIGLFRMYAGLDRQAMDERRRGFDVESRGPK
jgi:hypothetical protein